MSAVLQDPRVALLAQQVGRLTHELAQFKAEYLGAGLTPQTGCFFAMVPLGDAMVLVEYEPEANEPEGYEHETDNNGMGCPVSVSILNALVNGKMVDPQDWFAPETVAGWVEAIEAQLNAEYGSAA